MSLQDIRSECADTAALLQPYVDAELGDDDEQRVVQHLEACSGCTAAVQDQLWLRGTLRSLERPSAPQALRARVLLALDEVDREAETDAAEAREQSSSGWRTRLRNAMRGAMVMVPAGAVAALLFVAVRGAGPVSDISPTSLGASLAVTHEATPDEPRARDHAPPSLAELEPRAGFELQVARHGADVELVGAHLDDTTPQAVAASLRYRVRDEDGRTPRHLLDRQSPARGSNLQHGRPVTFRGQRYLLHRGERGRPIVQFERGGIAHTLVLEGAPMQTASEALTTADEADFSLLLRFADSHLQQR